MRQTSRIEISKSALVANVGFIRELLGPEVTFSSVVKGNAYGHGIDTYCPLIREQGVKHFSVFSAYEAYRVLSVVEDATVMIMGMIEPDQLEWVIENDIEFFVFDQRRIEQAVQVAKRTGKKARVHLELETGMNRTGFSPSVLNGVLKTLSAHTTEIEVVGLCTHLAGAESIANYKRISDQFVRFKRASARIDKLDWMNPIRHTACSAAAIRYPKSRMDLARIGILQYGFFPSNEVLVQYLTRKKNFVNPLQRIISWKSSIMELKDVKAGEFVGYGTSYFTNTFTRIAIVPVGYSNGFSRALSNQGRVLVRGRRLDVVGMVNMNMMAVDVTELDNVEPGDEVVMIGRQGDLEISVSSFSDYSNQVNYEMLTRLPSDIPRIIVE